MNGKIRTTQLVPRCVLRPVDVGSDGTREVTNADMQRHSDTAFVLTSEIVSKPVHAA